MTQELLASKSVVREVPSQIRKIESAPTAVLGLVGVTEKGPVGVATKTTEWEEYKAIFGEHVAGGDVSHSAQGYFLGGGKALWTVRTVHYSDVTDPNTATSATATQNVPTSALSAVAGSVLGSVVGPFNLEPGDTLVGQVDGNGSQTATFSATAPARVSGAETFALTNGWTLTLSVNGGATQTITFLTAEFVDIANATAEEVAAVINAKMTGGYATVTDGGTTVTITTDRRGTSAGLNIIGGLANGAFGFTTGNVAGTGNVADIDSVTVAEVKTIVEAAWTNGSGVTVTNEGGAVRITSDTTGGSSSVLVVAGSTADDELGLDNATHSGNAGGAVNTFRVDGKYPGTYAHQTLRIAAATSGEAARFNAQWIVNGVVTESFPNLSMDDTDDRYLETIINAESNDIVVVDLDAAVAAPNDRPANGDYVLAGGNDGLSSLADTDFIGAAAGVDLTGIRALDQVEDLTMLGVPNRATSAVHNAMVDYCDDTRNGTVFPIIVTPANLTATQAGTYFQTTAGLFNLSEFGAAYWPRIKIDNPDVALYGDDALITIDPTGDIAGCYAGSDARREGGVYDEPAGPTRGLIRRARGLETDEVMRVERRDLVYPLNINPIIMTTKGAVLDGTRNLLITGNFGSIAQRRGVTNIEVSVRRANDFIRHEGNTVDTRTEADRATRAYLVEQCKLKAFETTNPDEAFFLDTDVAGKTFNNALTRRNRQFKQRMGLATKNPIDWYIIEVSKDTRALEEALASG